jgi:hypothetical protein
MRLDLPGMWVPGGELPRSVFQPVLDNDGSDFLNKLAAPPWPDVVLKEAAIVPLGVPSATFWRVLFHEPVNKRSYRHRVKLLLRTLSIHLDAKILYCTFRIGLARVFLNARLTLTSVFRSPSSGIAKRPALSSAFGGSDFRTGFVPACLLPSK